MRRLEILLAGQGRAMQILASELEQQGHGAVRLTDTAPLEQCPLNSIDLLMEDGSLPPVHQWPHKPNPCVHLALRLAVTEQSESALPRLELLCWYEAPGQRQLLECLQVAPPLTGNGRDLVNNALDTLIDMVSSVVARLSRNSGSFLEHDTPHVPNRAPEQGLASLDALAFEHVFNHTTQPTLLVLAESPVLERIDASFAAFPLRPALTCADRTCSYAELQSLSLAIRERIEEAANFGKNPASLPVIAICLTKCTNLYAGILAILGTNAIYMPLDPSSPLQRQRYMLQSSGASLLLDDGHHPLRDSLPSLDISQVAPLARSPSLSPLMRQRPPENAPCMLLFTSGTSGQPKGVLLSQRNLSHFAAWYADYVQLSESSRVLQFSSLAFDSSLIDLLPTFIQGAELVIPTEDQRRDPIQLLELIHERSLTHAFLPPALLNCLPPEYVMEVEHVTTGGDICEPWVIDRLVAQCNLYNLYGPTETTVLISARHFQAGDNNRALGRPIANSQVLILDDEQRPVSGDNVGEVYISGPGVTLGYWGDAPMTAERYLSLEYSPGIEVRAYRTGDMARWGSEGIEFCGRRDQQVKVRGMRVEPAEIEQCLRESQSWWHVAVIFDERQRVLAFLSGPRGESADESLARARSHATQTLPDYMRPIAYTPVETFPYTSNGKIDRAALLQMPLEAMQPQHLQRPQNIDEERLCAIWAELLELPPESISTEESFFNLGGHSILLSRMLLKIREQFGRGICISHFVEAPTISTLGSLLRGVAIRDSVSTRAMEDALRPIDVCPLPSTRMGDPRKYVLTGANSFLGVHIVESLLANGANEVACLVRATATQSATERFQEALRDNHLEHLDLSRVRVYASDISQPRLGLSLEDYENIDQQYGVLIHNAARVNHVLDYEALTRENVESIFECLRLCEGSSKKIFNYISTLSACSRVDSQGRILEQPAAPTPPIYLRNGYNLTKWVAERVLQRACDAGTSVNLYRPGNISFNSLSGVCRPHSNRLLLMLKGSFQLGQVPSCEQDFDLMPVDFLARFIAFHANQHRPGEAVFNLHNPRPLSWDAYVEAFREAGQTFERVSVPEWQKRLVDVGPNNALFGVLGFYLNGLEEEIGNLSMTDNRNTLSGLHRMGVRYPSKSEALLRKGCEYLKEINFI